MNFWMQLITTIAEIALIGYLCKLSYEKGMIDHEQSIDIRGNENSPEGSSIGNSGARVQYIVSDPIEYHGPRKK